MGMLTYCRGRISALAGFQEVGFSLKLGEMNRAEIVLSAVPQALRNWFLEEKGIAFCISVNTEIRLFLLSPTGGWETVAPPKTFQ
jgi:hypothetical protein